MNLLLPKEGKTALEFLHFPTIHQAFIFRAWEYVPREKIAAVLKTSVENVNCAARDLGLSDTIPDPRWLKKGYITIIRQMWHILPYDQLLELLEIDEDRLALIMKEDDFLGLKLSDKPRCTPVKWRRLTEPETIQTARIHDLVKTLPMLDWHPFEFSYNIPPIRFEGKPNFDIRMIYAFSGLYQTAFDVDSEDYCPDSLLEAYRNLGINAVWTQAVLSQLQEYPFAPSISTGWQQRLARVSAFANRLEKYGMKLYLYINEPRSMPESFFDKNPAIRGHKIQSEQVCLCTSTTVVQKYLTDSIEAICRAVPNLGGFFTITRSENPTNCYSHSDNHPNGRVCNCPRCSKRQVSEVIGELISCIRQGADRVNPEIKVIAWDWAWREETENIIKALPKGVIFQSKSEEAVPFTRGGIKNSVRDYSISVLGPGEHAKRAWALAQECGLETCAKIQVNTSWEGSAIPALPVYPQIETHVKNLVHEGITNVMLSWTLGGCPSRNILHAAKYFYEKCDVEDESEQIQKAVQCFTDAFCEFPFDLTTIYSGPCNAGASNLLYIKPTGYSATMTCFAYDDLHKWRSIYPEEVFENQFAKLCAKWEEGLKIIEKEPLCETVIMAKATYCQYKSCLNQIRFYRARESNDISCMIRCAQSEQKVAADLYELMSLEPAIGYEAANHYYFSRGQLAEKIINCAYIVDKLSGVYDED